MRRSFLGIVCLALFTALTTAGSAQNCGGFPWTVTATSAGSQTVAVSVCGFYSGCQPHDPRYTIVGSQIHLTLQGSEPPDRCQCLAITGTFQQVFLVRPVLPGTYDVDVTLLSCTPPQPSGATTFTFDAISAIPALDRAGLAALALLIAAVAVFRLRR